MIIAGHPPRLIDIDVYCAWDIQIRPRPPCFTPGRWLVLWNRWHPRRRPASAPRPAAQERHGRADS